MTCQWAERSHSSWLTALGSQVKYVSILLAIGMAKNSHQEIVGASEGAQEGAYCHCRSHCRAR